MKIERSYEGKNFRVTVIIEAKDVHGHAWLTPRRKDLEIGLASSAQLTETSLEQEYEMEEERRVG